MEHLKLDRWHMSYMVARSFERSIEESAAFANKMTGENRTAPDDLEMLRTTIEEVKRCLPEGHPELTSIEEDYRKCEAEYNRLQADKLAGETDSFAA